MNPQNKIGNALNGSLSNILYITADGRFRFLDTNEIIDQNTNSHEDDAEEQTKAKQAQTKRAHQEKQKQER